MIWLGLEREGEREREREGERGGGERGGGGGSLFAADIIAFRVSEQSHLMPL